MVGLLCEASVRLCFELIRYILDNVFVFFFFFLGDVLENILTVALYPSIPMILSGK